MAGGRGTRLGADREKPLVRVGGRPMVDRVIDALRASDVDRIYVATSPHAPATREHVSAPAIETPGEGYVADLEAVLADDRIERPVLTAVADLPLLAPDAVDDVLAAHEAGSLTVAVPADVKERLGVSADTTFEHREADRREASGRASGSERSERHASREEPTEGRALDESDGEPSEARRHVSREVAPAGLNVVGDGPDRTLVVEDPRLAVNVNRPGDLVVARERA